MKTATLSIVLVLALATAPAAPASVRCSHSDGPMGVLRVLPFENPRIDLDFADGTVRRDGNRILVLEGLDKEVTCAGPPATVENTETILFLQGGLSFNELDLSGGLPAPHVEFRSELGALGYGIVNGTSGPDHWTLGGTTTTVSLALDPAAPEDTQVTWDGLGMNAPVLQLGKGNDTVDASAIKRRHTTTLIEGGEGNDTLIGSPFDDGIVGGPGHDILVGGAGNDELDGRDGEHDRLDCGAGAKDKARLGPDDSVKGCETVERPGRHRRRPPPKLPS